MAFLFDWGVQMDAGTLRLVSLLLGAGLVGCGDGALPSMARPPDMAARGDLTVCGPDHCCSDVECQRSVGVSLPCNLQNHLCIGDNDCLPDRGVCGAGKTCTRRNGRFTCTALCPGHADAECPANERCCGGLCSEISTDVMHCGACTPCPAIANGTPGCSAGQCVVASCGPGFDDCDHAVDNGCEVEIGRDPKHCGGCGRQCGVPFANGVATCSQGQCGGSCGPGFADCNAELRDGCEVAVGTDARNCGGCGKACAQGMVCDGGRCR